MAENSQSLRPTHELTEAGREFYRRGWALGTSDYIPGAKQLEKLGGTSRYSSFYSR